ncbi:MAG: hypothetical protein KC493_17190 [Bacteriovoracaceae bacterium]|nr:hypothetical protein [Bacteriovoracaceae bacterium]
MKFTTILICILFSTFTVNASEVDSFTNRHNWKIKDASKVINDKANEYFEVAVSKANKKSKSCEEKRLYKEMRKFFKNHYSGKFVPYILKSKDIEKIQTKFDDGVYRDFKWYEAFSIAAVKRLYKNSAAYIVKMRNVHIGTDKFEHFFGRGFRYFEKFYLEGKSLNHVLQFGHRSERIFLGAKTTGIYSQGDLAANFNGMRFWNDMLSKRPDILTGDEGFGPYIKCIDDQWVVNKKVDFNDYIDHSWDEGTNCSKLRTPSLLKKVLNQIDILEQKTGLPHHCPFVRENLTVLEQKYGNFIGSAILNFSGHDSLKK